MAALKFKAGLLLLGCLFSVVTSSPLKDKKDVLISRPSRLLRIKTVVRDSQNEGPSSVSSRRMYPDPQSPVAHFDSSLRPPTEEFRDQDHITQQKEDGYISSKPASEEVSQLTGEQVKQRDKTFQSPESATKQSLRSSAGHSHLPAVANFGDRIQKNGQDSKPPGCHVKGSCSTVSFTSDGQISLGSVTNTRNNFERVPQATTVSPYDQQQQFTVPDQTQIAEEFKIGQNKEDSYNGNQNFPDDQYKISQESSNGKSTGITRDEVTHQNGFQTQSQFVEQKDSHDYNEGKQFEDSFPTQQKDSYTGHSRQGSSSSGLRVEQTYENMGSNYEEQRNFDGFSQFEQQPAPQGSIITNRREPQDSGIQQGNAPHDGSHQGTDDGQYYHYGNPIDWLRYSVPGNPGEDYPILYQVPPTSFNCKEQPFSAGIFGDMEASCQVFHVCKENGGQDSFLCPNGTVFNQQYFVCDWWYNFRCSDTPSFYNLNADLYWDWESFTPSQMLNVPSSNNDGSFSNSQSGSEDHLSSFSNNGNGQTARGETIGQNNVVKSTIAIDNSAIADKNLDVYDQRLEGDNFAHGEPSLPDTGNVFQNMQQGFYEQQTQGEHPPSFTSEFSDTTRGLDFPAISNFNDSRLETIPVYPSFTGNNNVQNGNNFNPVASDTGASRQPAADAGTRYPDQNSNGQQLIRNTQSQDNNRPLFDTQRNVDSSLSGDNFSQEKPYTQEFVPVDFDNKSPFDDSTSGTGQNTQNNFGGIDQITQFDISNQQVSPDTRNNGESYDTQLVQQEHLSDSFNGRPGIFNPSRNDDIHTVQGSFISSQDKEPGVFDKNEKHHVLDINQMNQEVQEYISTSFGNQPGGLSTRDASYNQQNEGINTQNHGSFDIHQQNILTDDRNKDNRLTDGVNGNAEIQQQHISTSFESNRPNSFQNENVANFDQTQNAFNEDQRTTPIETDVKENFENTRSTISPVIQENQEIQQDYISTSFDDQRGSEFGTGERGGSYDTNAPFENGQNEDTRDFNSHEQSPAVSQSTQNIDENEVIRQEHISSFPGDIRDGTFDSMRNKENYNKDYGSTQTTGHTFSQANNADSNFNTNAGVQNADVNQGIQQEYISSFDDTAPSGFDSNENPNSERRVVSDHRHTTASFLPNGQNAFGNEGSRQLQTVGGNQEIRQEHVSVPFNGFRPNGINSEDNNRNNNLHDEFLTTINRGNTITDDNQQVSFGNRDNINGNNYHVTQQKDISDQFGENRPNDYDQEKQIPSLVLSQPNDLIREIRISNSHNKDNQAVQQDDVFNTFDGSNTGAFIPRNNEGHNSFISSQDQPATTFPSNEQINFNRDQNYGLPDSQQGKISTEVQQTDVPVTFSDNTSKTFQSTGNGEDYNRQQVDSNLNQGSTLGINTQNTFGNTDETDGNYGLKLPEVQQEYVPATFDDSRPNGFASSENDGGRKIQEEFSNVQGQDSRFNGNPQNTFTTGSNNNQHSFQITQNLRQEHISTYFDSNHQSSSHTQNSFRQEGNRGRVQQQSQSVSPNGYQQNSFEMGANGGNQNTNAAFQMRLENFQPTDIHMVNRGGMQNGNYDQQRLSFRPYGQNHQESMNYPGVKNPVTFVSNSENGAPATYFNDRGPSNRNFFVTNGHQVRADQPQQIASRPLADQGPANNNQDFSQYGMQDVPRYNQDQFRNGPLNIDRNNDDTESQKTDITQVHQTSFQGSDNVNSGVKGYSSENYSNGRSADFSTTFNAEINPRGAPTVFIKPDDVVSYNQPAPESTTLVNYNGWKPVVKY